MYTRKRPASEICAVTRQPLVEIGSFVTCTGRSWPVAFVVRLVLDVLGLGLDRAFVVFGLEQIRGVEEGALFEADVDERCLDAREDGVYAPVIDVTNCAPLIGPIDEELDQAVVLEDGHPRLARGAGNENLALHGESSRSARARGRCHPRL